MQRVTVSIITIGDELLIGQTIDTNSAWMAQELNKAGIWVQRRVAVGDVREAIWQALDEEAQQSDIILITGGLGPTADDITKPLLCDYFGGKLVVNQEALDNVIYLLEQVFKRPRLERNMKQAEVPDVCTVIQNKKGTAPGMWFEKEGKIFVSMPGVPHEMKGMMSDYVIPQLTRHFTLPVVLHRTLLTAGQGESMIAESLMDFEAALPENIKLAYLPSFGMVKLRLTTSGEDQATLEAALETKFQQLQGLVQEYLVSTEDAGMDVVVGKLLKTQGKTLSTAESCTGGYIAHLMTQTPGASDYFWGSIVSYDNSIKTNLLGVPASVLTGEGAPGAVSEEAVQQMVRGCLEKMGTDYALAVSGIMGPGGGTEEKPTGTVWMAAGNREKISTTRVKFPFDRKRNIEQTAVTALNFLRRFILENS
jgi:nicotinamide-nucleotide amidase